MARTLPLNASAQTVLSAPDGSMLVQGGGVMLVQGGGAMLVQGGAAGSGGNGQVSVGPTAQGEIWQAGYVVAVHCSTNDLEAMCRIYAGGGVSPAYFIGGTTWGSSGDSTGNTPQLQVGQQIYAVWTGGDPGAEAYLSITGMRTI